MSNNRTSFLLLILATCIWVLTAACVALDPESATSTGSLETAEEPDAPAAQPEPAAQPKVSAPSIGKLGGTMWSLVAYGDSSALQAMAIDSEITAEFSADGRLSGNAGCNRYMATFEVNDSGEDSDRLAVGPVGLTRMMCADDAINEQEQQFVGLLERMAEGRPFQLSAKQLEIDLGDGKILIFQSQ